MRKLILTILICLFPTFLNADDTLPVVKESVDGIAIIILPDSDHQRIAFIKNGQLLATRLMVDELIFGIDDGKPCLIWQDYWTAERIVYYENISFLNLNDDPTQEGNGGEWWNMNRNMKDLKQP